MINLILVLAIWFCPRVESSLVLLEEGVCYDQCILLAKLSLCPASFRIPRPNLPVTPGVSWLPTFAFQSTIMKGTSFGVLVLEGLVGLHRTIQLQLLQHYWSGQTWILVILNGCLRNKQRSFCRFWDCIQVLHFRFFCWLWQVFKLKLMDVNNMRTWKYKPKF